MPARCNRVHIRAPPIRSAGIVALTALMLCLAPSVSYAAYPERVITLIVPFAAGGPTDIIARIVSLAFPELLGQSRIIDNRGGGRGNPGLPTAARATPAALTLPPASTATAVCLR